MKLIKTTLVLALLSTPVLAVEDETDKTTSASLPTTSQNDQPVLDQENLQSSSVETVKAPTAFQWLERLSHSMRNLNFDTSFVVVRNNRAEPYRWLHGKIDDQELEVITLLNGPRSEAVRINSKVTYFESDQAPYSIDSGIITGPIPAALFSDVNKLQHTYTFVGVGKSRILGRPAQLVRLESKDKQRFGYWLWLDIKSGLLLKAAVISREGELLEQIQFTHLSITEKSNELLSQISAVELPEPLLSKPINVELPWQVNWLPDGFELIKTNKRYIDKIGSEVESLMFNDGLVDVSVYVMPSDEAPRQASVNQTGATVLLSLLREGYEITVVGKVPAQTAAHIADSVTFNVP